MRRTFILFYALYNELSIISASQTKEELSELQKIIQRNSKLLKERHGEEELSHRANENNNKDDHIISKLNGKSEQNKQEGKEQERRHAYAIDEVGGTNNVEEIEPRSGEYSTPRHEDYQIDGISHSSGNSSSGSKSSGSSEESSGSGTSIDNGVDSGNVSTTHTHSGTTHSHDIIVPNGSGSWQCLWGWSCACSSSSDIFGSDAPGGLKIIAGTGTSLSHSHSITHAHSMPSDDSSSSSSKSGGSGSKSGGASGTGSKSGGSYRERVLHDSAHSGSHSSNSHAGSGHTVGEFHHGNHEHGSGHSGSAHSASSFSGQSGSVKHLWIGKTQYHKDADCECRCNEPPTSSPVSI